MARDDGSDVPADWGGGLIPCPSCAEPIRAQAKRCRFCGYVMDGEPTAANPTVTAVVDAHVVPTPAVVAPSAVNPMTPTVVEAPVAPTPPADARSGSNEWWRLDRGRLIVLTGVVLLGVGLLIDVWFKGGAPEHSMELGLWRVSECTKWSSQDSEKCHDMQMFTFADKQRAEARQRLGAQWSRDQFREAINDARKMTAGGVLYIGLVVSCLVLTGVLFFAPWQLLRRTWPMALWGTVVSVTLIWWLTMKNLFDFELGTSLFLVPIGIVGVYVGTYIFRRDIFESSVPSCEACAAPVFPTAPRVPVRGVERHLCNACVAALEKDPSTVVFGRS